MSRMRDCEVSLAIVPHATHLFAEPGALEQVATMAAEWFEKTMVIGSVKR